MLEAIRLSLVPRRTAALLPLLGLGVIGSAHAGPTIKDIHPDQGHTHGGTQIHVHGNGFESGSTVTMCGERVQEQKVLDGDEILVVTAPHAAGICDLVVTAPDGTQTTLAASFRYTDAAPHVEHDDHDHDHEDGPEYQGRDTVVTGTRVPRRMADTPVLTELIPAEQIEAKGAVCLIDALTYEPGVRVDNMCSICNTTGVKLAGMPGRYTSLLIDGVPIYSSLGQTYGWLMLSAADIQQIEIVKGANSVLYGTDAIGGVVNVITKRPSEDPDGRVTAEYGAFDYHYLTGSASVKRHDVGVALVATHTAHDAVDRDSDEVSEFTAYQRANMAATVTYDTEKVEVLSRVSITQETRQGGGMGSYIEVLDGEQRSMSETVLSQRIDGSAVIDVHASDVLDLETTIAASQHLQDSDYEGEVYVGEQHMLYLQQSAVALLHDRYSLVAGGSYRGEVLEENLAIGEYQHHQGGAFLQGDWAPARSFELLHGARFDYHNVYGPNFTPRLSARYSPVGVLTLRATGGTGFRAPTTFYEYAHGVRPDGYTLLMNVDKAERSLNAAGSAVLDLGRPFRASVEGAFNRVNDPITVGVTTDGDIEVYNADGHLDVISVEGQIQSAPTDWLQLAAGYGHYVYDDTGGALVSAPPSDTIDLSADLSFDFGLIANAGLQVYGPMDLVGVYGPAFNGSSDMAVSDWLDPANADTSAYKLETSPWYATLDARIEQRVGETVAVYLGGKNLTDYHQNDVETPLMFPETEPGVAGPVDVVYLWGPARGRFLYGGVKVDL